MPQNLYAPQVNQQQLQKRQDPGIYSTVMTSNKEQSSLRREPEPSPPPPLPSSQPPPIASQDRTFVDELKQRNLRNQRPSNSSGLSRDQEEQTLTLFAEPDELPKQNGPTKSEKLFSDLFKPPEARRQIYPRKEEEDSDDAHYSGRPVAAPRHFQTDRPDISDKITVSLSYYKHNDEHEKPKVFI